MVYHNLPWKHVSAVYELKEIVKGFCENLWHLGAQALLLAVDMDFWWPYLGEDCILILAHCNACYV